MRYVLKWFGLLTGILAVIYVGGVLLFWNKFLPGTTVGGREVGLLSPEEVTVDLLIETQQNRVYLTGVNGVKESMSFQELGVYRQMDNQFVGWELPSWTWFFDIWHPVAYDVGSDWFYDVRTIDSAVRQLDLVTGNSRNDKSDLRVVQQEDGQFALVRTMDGQYVNVKRLVQVVQEHLDAGDVSIDLVEEDCYLDTGEIVEGADVESQVSLAELQAHPLTVCLDDILFETVPEAVQAELFYVSDDKVMIRSNVLYSYVVSLADRYNTDKNPRMFRSSLGTEVDMTSVDGSTYQGYVLDESGVFAAMLNQLVSGDFSAVDAVWLSKGGSLTGESDIGDTYLELSLESQHLWYYVDGVCVTETDVVTGQPDKGYATPSGMYFVRQLYTDYRMYYPDGAADCSYFISVTPDGVGIHDATWKDAFGGTLYQIQGSHGCVNVPLAKVQEIFESLEGLDDWQIPVVIY